MNDGAAHAEGRRPKASKGGNRAGGTYAGAARSIYEDLRAARNLNGRRFSTAAGLEYEHNFDGTARILLNGDFSFRAACDFKELGVAKISHATNLKLCAPQRRGRSEYRLQFRAGVLLATIPTSPICTVSQSRSFVALLGLRRNRADRQVFDPARAQQADRFVGDGDAPLVSESCTAQDAPSRYRVCLAPAAAIYRASGLVLMGKA